VDTVLALGFDLFFKPKLNEAAARVGIELRYAQPKDALASATSAARVVADVSSPGVQEALASVRAAFPTLPIVACFPHVEVQRAAAVRALGGPVVAIPRGAFAADLASALAGKVA
jgi:hypothetical protein